MQAIVLVLCSLMGAQRPIDTLDYADTAAARAAWVAAEGTPAVQMAEADGSKALVLEAPFARQPELRRVVIDRRMPLKLQGAGHFTLQVKVDPPEAVDYVNLYFHSGGGWYSAGRRVAGAGWQTLRFSMAAYGTEESPDGWNAVDGVRIAAWRGKALNARVMIRNLEAVSHDVTLVVPGARADGNDELRTARSSAEFVGELLAELGIETDTIGEDAVVEGALGERPLAVLAYNPGISAAAVAALKGYVTQGGKLLVCYRLPAGLEKVLGFGQTEYYRPQRPGALAEIRFTGGDVRGLPPSVRQASWNITVAQPIGLDARVIGHWYDDRGQPTGKPALLLSRNGAFFSHIVLSDDPDGKRQMLAAVLGHLYPPLWRQVGEHVFGRAVNVGGMSGLEALVRYVDREGRPQSERLLAEGHSAMAAGRAALRQQQYAEALQLARRAHDAFARAYLTAQRSLPVEGRGFWNHSGTGAYPGDWERSARLLEENGLNMILPNMLWGGVAHYRSDVLPRSTTFGQYGDQIDQCCTAAHRHGLEVHVWKVNFNLGRAPQSLKTKLAEAGRLQMTDQGEQIDWLCPSHPENRKLELDSMLEVARNYPVDGLHFDYIRYPGKDSCYCPGCRKRFEAQRGQTVEHWPEDCRSGPLREQYNDWRCQQITLLVEAVSREARRIRPELKISAAVFGSYPDCRESVAQDWPLWVRQGYLDFVCPMDYTDDDAYFRKLVANQVRLVEGRVPIYAGIGATASRCTLSADRVAAQIDIERKLGAGGFMIFNFQTSTAEQIAPGLGLGICSEPAQVPHRAAAQ